MATIKAGTYRFNDVLTAPSDEIKNREIPLDFTVTVTLPLEYGGGTHICVCNSLNLSIQYMFYAVSIEPELPGVSYPYSAVAYFPEEYQGYYHWNVQTYGEGIQTITIPNDTEVSSEFYEWFTANAVEQKEISGKWKFKDYLTPISGLNESVSFTAKYSFEYQGTHSGTVSCNGLSFIEGDGYAFRVRSMLNGLSNPTDQIIAESVVGVPFPFEAAIYTEYMNGYDYGFSFISEGFDFQTIDFGTEPQIVSVDFYNWFTENATQPSASITYNGSTIASLFGGDRATLKCAGMMMESDVVVEVAEI